ncbi:LysR substrate-binding domain-containing protein [Anaeromyxobacter sp. Red801]|uniref:LysR substrate-binding domain-containing protein n=1 Tax=Anaeromyxobacter sp. Red801 TaxID=3411632 RepID=UPI003BA227C3
MPWPRFDLPLLHTLVAAVDAGGLVRAAARVGLTPSAVSLQMRRLEAQAGCALLRKQGRRLVPTPAGERLVSYARRLLQLDEEAHAALQEDAEAGVVRLGAPQDVAERWLPGELARFARTRPRVRLEVVIERSAALREALAGGRLDLALLFGEEVPGAALLGELPMEWLASAALPRPARGEPLPLVLFDPPCAFRSAAIAALDGAGLPWRLALTSPSLSVLWASAAAGLGATARTPLGAPAALRPAGRRLGLPRLAPVRLWLHRTSDRAAPAALADALAKALRDRLAAQPRRPGDRG